MIKNKYIYKRMNYNTVTYIYSNTIIVYIKINK